MRPASPRRRPLDAARDALVEAWRTAGASPFSHPDVCDAAAAAFGLDVAAWSAGDAHAIAFEKSVGPARVLALPPLLPVSAPMLASTPSASARHGRATDLDALVKALGAHYTQATFALPSDWTDPRTFAFAGWRVEARFTYVVDLPSTPAQWSRGRRQDARVDGTKVRIGADDSAHAIRFQIDAYRRKNVPFGPSAEQMTAVAGAVRTTGALRTVVAVRDGTVEAAALFAVAGDQATYWLAGSTPGPAMAILFASAFEALTAEGVATVDLGGANVPGVAEFKRQFGARLVPAYRVRHAGPRWLRLAQALR